jgi:hypothetical protein
MGEIHLNYNPDALTFQPGEILQDVNGVVGNFTISFIRPDGDYLAALNQHLQNEKVCNVPGRHPAVSKDRRVTHQLSVLWVAALEKLVPREHRRLIEVKLKDYKAEGYYAWRQLQLFNAVATMAEEFGYDLPECIQEPRKAWGETTVREIQSERNIVGSKNQYIPILRQELKMLKAGQNPADIDQYPEIYHAIAYAFLMAKWNPEVELELSNRDRANRKSLRKNVADALENYQSAIRGLIEAVKDPNYRLATIDAKGNYVLVENNGKRSIQAPSVGRVYPNAHQHR